VYLTLREELGLTVFENRVLRTSEPKKEQQENGETAQYVLLINYYYYDDQINDGMGETCSMHETRYRCTQNFSWKYCREKTKRKT
jgi:hypothetical protein